MACSFALYYLPRSIGHWLILLGQTDLTEVKVPPQAIISHVLFDSHSPLKLWTLPLSLYFLDPSDLQFLFS